MKMRLAISSMALAALSAIAAPGIASAQAPPATTVTPPKPPAKPETPAIRARHEKCLAFIRRQGLTCDPWVQPTCGYETGLARPLECVPP